MKRKITCAACGRDCGEIRDASLLKALRFLCGPCDLSRIEGELTRQQASQFNKIYQRLVKSK